MRNSGRGHVRFSESAAETATHTPERRPAFSLTARARCEMGEASVAERPRAARALPAPAALTCHTVTQHAQCSIAPGRCPALSLPGLVDASGRRQGRYRWHVPATAHLLAGCSGDSHRTYAHQRCQSKGTPTDAARESAGRSGGGARWRTMGTQDGYTYRTCTGTAICARTVLAMVLRSGTEHVTECASWWGGCPLYAPPCTAAPCMYTPLSTTSSSPDWLNRGRVYP